MIALHGIGIEHAIAVSGTAMTEQHIAAILRYTKEHRFVLMQMMQVWQQHVKVPWHAYVTISMCAW